MTEVPQDGPDDVRRDQGQLKPLVGAHWELDAEYIRVYVDGAMAHREHLARELARVEAVLHGRACAICRAPGGPLTPVGVAPGGWTVFAHLDCTVGAIPF